jgi:ATP-dependent RNA helicase SUPV3L1/SUV3
LGLTVSPSEIRQIAGRAGRFYVAEGIEPYRAGFVTTLYEDDYEGVKEAMESAAVPLPTAGILPPPAIIQQHAAYFPVDTPFEIILLSLAHICKTSQLFHMCDPLSMMRNARVLDKVEGLSVADRIGLCLVPVGKDMDLFEKLVLCIAEKRRVSILDIPELELDVVDEDRPKDPRKVAAFMDRLEWLHQGLVLYSWMSLRFSNILMHPELAAKAKTMVEEKIESALQMKLHHRHSKARKRPSRRSFSFGRMRKPKIAPGASTGTLPGPADWRRFLSPHLLDDMRMGAAA